MGVEGGREGGGGDEVQGEGKKRSRERVRGIRMSVQVGGIFLLT